MRSIVVVSLVLVLTTNSACAQAPREIPAVPATPLRSQVTSDVVREAVKEALAADKKAHKPVQETALGAEKYENFSRDFAEAKVPDCLHSEGLKRQPTFFLAGLLALPFVLVAAARGKCN
jgi:hypothetical protein